MSMKCIKCKHLESKGKESLCKYCNQTNRSNNRFNYFEEKYPVKTININNGEKDSVNFYIQDELFSKW